MVANDMFPPCSRLCCYLAFTELLRSIYLLASAFVHYHMCGIFYSCLFLSFPAPQGCIIERTKLFFLLFHCYFCVKSSISILLDIFPSILDEFRGFGGQLLSSLTIIAYID
ncbi:hypothetical protein BP00DRAFT_123500 [Aspergillus indologenus CBS 114.80]|uniref:Uncharacterized protein n=1 Tax=Aspergillus indologenus CBS 114.80 TaxID=1450541 RepID=A0A2V5HL01_9EURO|nr:hypothetical protein BP00DRAFT_123500 [Aspergillus indologenus CBS 114.80]